MEQLAADSLIKNSTLTNQADTDSLINFSNDSLNGDRNPTDTESRRLLEVTGQGKVSVPTNIAQVELGILVQAQTATEAQQQLAQRSAAAIEVLQNREAQELQTTGLQLNPVYSFENNTQRLTGYEGRNTLQFRVPTEEAGATIDAAIQAGANVVQSISFTASETALQQARLQALSQAVQDAQTQADAVLSTLQLTPGEIIDIDISGVETPPPMPTLFAASEAQTFAATTPILGGPQTIEASVSLDILYSPALTGISAADNGGLLGI